MAALIHTDALHRTSERRHLSLRHRTERLEEDADRVENALLTFADKLDGISKRLTWLLCSTLLATLALVVNLVGKH